MDNFVIISVLLFLSNVCNIYSSLENCDTCLKNDREKRGLPFPDSSTVGVITFIYNNCLDKLSL